MSAPGDLQSLTQTTAQLLPDHTRLGMPSLSLFPSPFRTCLPETPVCLRWNPDSLPCNSFTHYMSARDRHTPGTLLWTVKKHWQILALKELTSQ